jgi:F-type H+-transporting ATPase subunit delta
LPQLQEQAARHYARAAFQLAIQEDRLESWLQDISTAASALADPGVHALLISPAISEDRKLAAARRALDGAEPMLLNLVLLLIRRRRIALLPEVAAEFERLANEHRGIVLAEMTTAVPLDAKLHQSVVERLSRMLGKKVRLQARVDQSIIAGLVLRVGDTVLDGSVAGRLSSLRRDLT